MKAIVLVFLASIPLWSEDIAEYKFVPNFPNRRVASYFATENDLKAIELSAGMTDKAKFSMPLVEVEYGGFHIDDLEQRRKEWLSKAEPHVSEIKISTLIGKTRLSAVLKSKDDPQFKITYVAYILYEAPKIYSLVRIFFPKDDGPTVTEQESEKILTQLFDPNKKTQTYILKPVFPDSNFFSFDTSQSQQVIYHYSNDIHSFENIKKHLMSDNIAAIDKYFESKARRNLSFLKPQKIFVGKAAPIQYDKLLEYFVYLESYKKHHPNERGELTRTIVTIFGHKGKIVYYFAECMDDPKFNIQAKPNPKDWLNEALTNYGSQRSPEYLNWIKRTPY